VKAAAQNIKSTIFTLHQHSFLKYIMKYLTTDLQPACNTAKCFTCSCSALPFCC